MCIQLGKDELGYSQERGSMKKGFSTHYYTPLIQKELFVGI